MQTNKPASLPASELKITNAHLEVLSQCDDKAVWDGDIISKRHRDELWKAGYLFRADGFTTITKWGKLLLKGCTNVI